MAHEARPLNQSIGIKYGHDQTHVVLLFSGNTNHIRLTEAQTEDAIAALQDTLNKLREAKNG